MGEWCIVFMNLALSINYLSPIIVGAQLAIPFAILLVHYFLGENISLKNGVLVFTAFVGIIIICFDPNIS